MDFEFETLNLENTELQKLKRIANWYGDNKSSVHLFVKFHNKASRKSFLERGYISREWGEVSLRGKTRIKILTKDAVKFNVEVFNTFFEKKMKKGRHSPKKASLLVSLIKGHMHLAKVEDSTILKNFYYLLYNGFVEKSERADVYYPTVKAKEIFSAYEHLKRLNDFEDEKPEPGDLLYGIRVTFNSNLDQRMYELKEVELKQRFIVDDNSPAYTLSLIDLNNGNKKLITPNGAEVSKNRYFMPRYQCMTWLDNPLPILEDKKYYAVPHGILTDGNGLLDMQKHLKENVPRITFP